MDHSGRWNLLNLNPETTNLSLLENSTIQWLQSKSEVFLYNPLFLKKNMVYIYILYIKLYDKLYILCLQRFDLLSFCIMLTSSLQTLTTFEPKKPWSNWSGPRVNVDCSLRCWFVDTKTNTSLDVPLEVLVGKRVDRISGLLNPPFIRSLLAYPPGN